MNSKFASVKAATGGAARRKWEPSMGRPAALLEGGTPRLAPRWLGLVVALSAGACPASAFFGASVVTVVADVPAERHFVQETLWWNSQLAKMTEVIRNGTQLVAQGREAAAVAGDPRRLGASVAGPATVLETLTLAGRLPDADTVRRAARPVDATRHAMLGYHRGRPAIGDRFQALGANQVRDTWTYADLATEDALRSRLERSLRTLDEVEAKENRVHRDLHARLRFAPTAAEVELVRVALASSELRAEFARSQVRRAQIELDSVRDARLADQERTRRAVKEEAEVSMDELARRLGTVEATGGLR